jgi:hypothetical protein
MKRSVFLSLLIFSQLAINTLAQINHDVISRDNYSIMRAADNPENSREYKLSGLKSREKAELLKSSIPMNLTEG